MIKKIATISFISLFVLIACKNNQNNEKVNSPDSHENHKEKTEVKKKALSPHTSAMTMIGDAHIHIDYSSPGVRGRIIFGGLVGYDSVWQAGAHMATWIETNKDLIINGEALKAGKYGFFVIPSRTEWTIIFNKNWEQHGKDEYDEKENVIRFMVQPEISDKIVEHLNYKINKISNTEGTITLAWEKASVTFPFELKN